jgi:hypothetical protein
MGLQWISALRLAVDAAERFFTLRPTVDVGR